jgi:hypothetical protein
MDFDRLAARYVCNEMYVHHLPDLAVEALLENYYTPSLVLLAGETGSTPTGELRELFLATLAELGVALPDPVRAARTVMRELAQHVVDGTCSPVSGAESILKLFYELGYMDPRYQTLEFLRAHDIERLVTLAHELDDTDSLPRVVAAIRKECARLAGA